MNIEVHDSEVCSLVERELHSRDLRYGTGETYTSLITPSSTVLCQKEAETLLSDLVHLWQLYRTCNELYLEAREGNVPTWIARLCESGLTPAEITVQQNVSAHHLEPWMTRIDYLCLGKHGKICEVQWKSGGPGLFFGIAEAYRSAIPFSVGQRPLGSLIDSYAESLGLASNGRPGVVVNESRSEWHSGEEYLRKELLERGIHYVPINRDDFTRALRFSQNSLYVCCHDKVLPVSVLRGRGFTEKCDDTFIKEIGMATVDGRVWVETPLNYIYRQKWGLALPFMKEFRQFFPERVREIIPATALVRDIDLDLTEFYESFSHPQKELLLRVRNLLAIAELPSSLRKQLILKCGAGTGKYQSRGMGVFRLTGSQATVRKTLGFVQERVATLFEPWILQKFIDAKSRIPIEITGQHSPATVIDAHARIMVFGTRNAAGQFRVSGGLGNYGSHWKVSGQRVDVDSTGTIKGTAFNDIRVSQDSSSERFSIMPEQGS